ncbi:hypothetical protein C8R45DRAFT_1079185, partial [Mycena sanguinolenta]
KPLRRCISTLRLSHSTTFPVALPGLTSSQLHYVYYSHWARAARQFYPTSSQPSRLRRISRKSWRTTPARCGGIQGIPLQAVAVKFFPTEQPPGGNVSIHVQ